MTIDAASKARALRVRGAANCEDSADAFASRYFMRALAQRSPATRRYIESFARQLERDYLAGEDGRAGTADDRVLVLNLAAEMNGCWNQW